MRAPRGEAKQARQGRAWGSYQGGKGWGLTAGFLTTARAMATRCFCPPLSWMPPSPSRVLYLRRKHARGYGWVGGADWRGGRAVERCVRSPGARAPRPCPPPRVQLPLLLAPPTPPPHPHTHPLSARSLTPLAAPR